MDKRKLPTAPQAGYWGAYVESICGDKLRSWDQALPQIEIGYNSTMHGSTGMSPFAIVYQKVPHHPIDLAQLPVGEKFQ